jgi:hypothetical protein
MNSAVAQKCRRRSREPPRSRHTVGATLSKLLRPHTGRYLTSRARSRHASDETGDIAPPSQNYIPIPRTDVANRGGGAENAGRLTTATPVEGATYPQPPSVHAIVCPRETTHSESTTRPDGPKKGPETSARIDGVGHGGPRTRLPLPSPSPEGSINLPLSRESSPRVGCAGPTTQHPCQPHQTQTERRANR